MMSPRHHPCEDRLLEHAVGALPVGRDLVVAAHVAVCETCRAEVRMSEAVGGSLLDALPPAPMADDSLAHALARIERPAPPAPVASHPTPPDWIAFGSPLLERAWRRRRWAAPGVWVSTVERGPGEARAYLLRVGAGMSVPRHRHRGAELVTVLKGAYDDRGDLHGPGDFAENDEAVDHKPTVTRDGECVCLICADSPLIPLDWVGRVFQPLVRI
jgi:putative transcriptional regulator